ncbi:MAG: DMT family transporter [Candidatus Aminicenantes bacterium]|nr:DMT family transporter [Candidatus Aminicenantes bacterium]
MPAVMPYLGEILALVSGLFWAGAIILFKVTGRNVPPLGLNLFKNMLGVALLTLTMLLAGQAVLPRFGAGDYFLILASGALGLGVSDTLYFFSLNALGASPATVVAALYSPFTIILSLTLLGERLSPAQTVGVLLILAAVLIISYHKSEQPLPKKKLWMGIALGVLAQLFTALSIVMIKRRLEALPLLWATNIRVAGGLIFLVPVIAFHPRRRGLILPLLRRSNWKVLVPAAVLGTYLSLLFWLGGMKYTQASIASALNQLNIVFVFLMAVLFLREKHAPLKTLAVVMAAAGAFLASAL